MSGPPGAEAAGAVVALPPTLAGMMLSAPMAFAMTVEFWLFLLLKVVALGLEVWAVADAALRPAEAFVRAGERTKTFWLLLTGGALAVGLLTTRLIAGFDMFSLAALCVAAVYLAGPRERMAPRTRR
ncbi:DUF2516 family protein [Micrococcus sp.]|uniref:DUF2516 family protein n=1 Tax=Micrococcus sp. TaxID=1271 RepID=UPI002A90CEB1|nr:DUF2516 family protein [Micrococcus sp.]MDY6055185.1 DUF2516 family protein [Micrococcus sp.]